MGDIEIMICKQQSETMQVNKPIISDESLTNTV